MRGFGFPGIHWQADPQQMLCADFIMQFSRPAFFYDQQMMLEGIIEGCGRLLCVVRALIYGNGLGKLSD